MNFELLTETSKFFVTLLTIIPGHKLELKMKLS